ncbi:MAG TPA: AsmA family protein, partial [Methylomirabilota bacterium]|nr:AsmA family protein [Methylomirabilota bacterium]
MRRPLLISAVAVGTIFLIAAALVAYAFFNLNSIVSKNQKRILARVSDALGRRVDVGQIKARMGFGVSIEVSGLKIADDAAFSEQPFLSANEVSVEVEFVPLLYGDAKVTRLELINPDIRIVRNARGDLNIDSIGANAEEVSPAKKRHTRKKSSLADLSVKALSVENGSIYYNDLAEKAAPIEIHRLDFDVNNFSAVAAFDVDMKLAFPGDEQNVA